jgi:predicted ester cyclase
MVVIRGRTSGTHDGEFMGHPPTGRRFSVEQMHWLRVEGGKVAEHWAVRDDMGHARQLGLLPEPGAAR